MEYCQSKHSPKTVQTYREGAVQFVGYTQKRGMPLLAEVRREHVEDFLGSLRERGNKPATVANRHRALRALFNWMIHEDLRREHPMERIKPPEISSQVLPHYSDDDIRRLLKSIPDKAGDELLLRDRAIVLALLDTGLRAQELCDVRLRDLDRQGATYPHPRGQGRQGAARRLFVRHAERAQPLPSHSRRLA